MGDMIHETLTLFEKHGGEDAFINIKSLARALWSLDMFHIWIISSFSLTISEGFS